MQALSDTYFMNEALKEAQKALAANEVPVGAVIVCRGRIVARAHNLTERLNDVTAHAEMQAITAAAHHLGGKYLEECVLYVTLEPCAMCAGAIQWARPQKVVYGAPDEKKGYTTIEGFYLHPKTKVVKGLCEHESTSMLKSFFKGKRLD